MNSDKRKIRKGKGKGQLLVKPKEAGVILGSQHSWMELKTPDWEKPVRLLGKWTEGF